MNIYTNSNYDLATKRRKREEYRTILDNQVKEKQKMKHDKQRFQTQAEQAIPNYSSRYYSIENNSFETPKTRKFHQESNFLPHIDHSANQRQPYGGNHQRSLSYRNNSYGITQDTDIQTMEALTECEIIIDNLRKLRLKSLSSMKRKQKQFGYGLSPSNYDSNRNQFQSRYKTKQSSAEQEVRMFRGLQPSPNYKSKKTKIKKDGQNNSNSKKQHKKPSLGTNFDESAEMNQLKDEFQDMPKSLMKSNRSQQKEQNQDQSDEGKNENSGEYGIEQDQQGQEEKQETSRKRKFLLKYLAKAKFRGSKLHQKIMEHKNKTVPIPGKLKEEKDGDDQDSSQNNENLSKNSNKQVEQKDEQQLELSNKNYEQQD